MGDASRVGRGEESAFTKLCLELLNAFFFPDARRVALSLQQLSGAAANLQTLLNKTL